MQSQVSKSRLMPGISHKLIALICAFLVIPGDFSLLGPAFAFPQEQDAAAIPADQLDSLVAPIALYPDPLLSQVLVASTYPLEIVQLQQWLEKNKNLKDKALTDAVEKQDWDASIQALAPLPDVAKYLSDNIKWTTDLGNAFLAQQGDVMDAVQRMRKKAKDSGNLKSTEQQKVETKVVESKQVIVVEQANPQVVYVPSYNPTVVYGAPVYPYPPISYPPPGYYAAGMAISFGVGMMMGAAFSGGWGWNCGWGGGGHNNIYINNNNNFVNNSNRNTNINRNTNVANRSGNNTWQHNPQHRGGTPYPNRNTANRFNGTTRGDSLANRQANARSREKQQAGNRDLGQNGQRGDRQQAGDRDRGGNRPQQAAGRERVNSGDRQGGAGDRTSVSDRSANGGNRSSSGDRVGNRSVPSGGGSRDSSAFGGGGGMNGNSARSSSARGSSSMGASRGGGSRGGGGGGRRR
ncbi:MAG TPA: DUF3300 domain-containing protein [Candidatus Eisenbacteria bacterium]|nr:DUF3300 domain-containing protein [Candidatus Eisenbacteria bacterium]